MVNEHQAAPPFPCDAKLEETYLSPVDICAPNHGAYEDIGTYALPYKPNKEDLYSKPLSKKERHDRDALYTKVLPKNQRTKTDIKEGAEELHYAEIEHVRDKHSNLTASERTAEPHYAEISSSNYANICKDKSKKENGANSSSNYANVGKDIAKNKDANKSDCTNVYANETYVNISDDYVEPSYCQINLK